MNQLLSDRVHTLATSDHKGDSVLYVMSRDQRVHDNHALLAAQHEAQEHKLPLVVLFHVLPQTGFRAREHYEFMLDGLESVDKELRELNIPFILTYGEAVSEIPRVASRLNPRSIYFDFNPLPGVRQMQQTVSRQVDCNVYVVDTHNIVPAWIVSDKREYAAHTMRRKIHTYLETYLVEPGELQKHPYALSKDLESLSFAEVRAKISSIKKCGIIHDIASGSAAGLKRLQQFIDDELASYALKRNDIADDHQSQLSPYLHYGQVSSLRIALEVLYAINDRPLLFEQAKMAQSGETPSKLEGLNALFEEMIVRKELSDNYCLYTAKPTDIASAEKWARETLKQHQDDPRDHLYTREELEHCNTHDEAWNAAQKQMIKTGKMHGYMRMYWAKKMLEWSKTPQDAIDMAVYLNDHYSLDGGDPNGYVGIMWSITGVHDRPWTERHIFGKIRYMNEAGLRRKFDVDKYIKQWQ